MFSEDIRGKYILRLEKYYLKVHSFDKDNDKYTGIISGNESNTADYWNYSIEIAKK